MQGDEHNMGEEKGPSRRDPSKGNSEGVMSSWLQLLCTKCVPGLCRLPMDRITDRAHPKVEEPLRPSCRAGIGCDPQKG